MAAIGISDNVLKRIGPLLFENSPEHWSQWLAGSTAGGHKYDRGHALVVSGPPSRTGAARLVARAALRSGAGLVTLASPPEALAVNAVHLTEVMLARMQGAKGLAELLSVRRFGSVALGPALGTGESSKDLVRAALTAKCGVVLDADALTAYESDPDELFRLTGKCSGKVVLTPHGGEFRRLFGAGDAASKAELALRAASRSGAIVVYKGADTVIASPDGQAAVNANAPPWLATAGSGDVLAGIACGLLAQGIPPFEAACAAVWIHGAAAEKIGPLLIAGELESALPAVLSTFTKH